MTKWIGLGTIAISSVGIFFGFYYYFSGDVQLAVAIVTATTVGLTGVLAWTRHFIFHKQDAKALGWETERPDWMFEVGFANLGFGVAGLLAVFADMGLSSHLKAEAIALLGYSAYLFQAGLLHGYRYFTDKKKMAIRLWRYCLLTLVVAGMMAFFGIAALIHP